MSNYTITTNFGAKDSLPSGNAGKVIKGSEFTTEFTNIQTAVATKANTVSPTFTGAVTFDAAVTNNAAVTVNSTATITGDLAVDTNTLFVDVSENKVGIGTTSPQNTLTVGALETSGIVQDATVGIKSNANHKGIVLQENSGAEQWSMGVGEGGSLKFYDSDSATPAVTFADISGNVGIGTQSPASKLEIVGGNSGTDVDVLRVAGSNSALNVTCSDLSINNPVWTLRTFASEALAFSDGTDENMRIDANGNVGIGTDSPANTLSIKGSVNQLDIETSTTGVTLESIDRADLSAQSDLSYYARNGEHKFFNGSYTESMRIDTSGNVGIGTSSPSAKLEVSATAPTYTNLGTVLWGGTTNNDNHTGISLSSSGDALGGSVGSNLYYSNSNTATQSNTNRSSGEIKIDNTTGTGTSAIRLGGYAKGTTTFNEHMRIDSSGNVGIGTTSPDRPLDITDDTNDGTGGLVIHSYLPTLELDDISGSGTNFILQHDATNTLFKHGTTERMRIDSSGNLLVDTTSTGATGGGFSFRAGSVNYMNITHASSVGHGNYFAAFKHNDTVIGTITKTNTTGVSYNTSSDERLKENITDSADAGSKVDAIQIRQYDWKADGSHQDYGVIAQELLEVAPEAVHQPVDEEDMMGVDYSKLVPMLIKEVQSLRSRVAELENV